MDSLLCGTNLFILSKFEFFFFNTSRHPFYAALDRLENGSWRPITESGKRTLVTSLLTCSNNPLLKDPEDPAYYLNLATGIKHDELSAFMPKSWITNGFFYYFYSTHISVSKDIDPRPLLNLDLKKISSKILNDLWGIPITGQTAFRSQSKVFSYYSPIKLIA